MDRRRFLVTALVSTLTAPLAAEAQTAGKVWRIGVLGPGVSGPGPGKSLYEAFVVALREFGYIEGHTLAIEARYSDGHMDRLPDLAAELARLKGRASLGERARARHPYGAEVVRKSITGYQVRGRPHIRAAFLDREKRKP